MLFCFLLSYNIQFFYNRLIMPRRQIILPSADECVEYMKSIHPDILDMKPTKFNMTIEDFNYITNEIVNWTISDKPFEEFVEDVKNNKRIYNNLLSYIWCFPSVVYDHIYYLMFVVAKFAEYMKLNGLLYLIYSPKYTRREFNAYYIHLINKRFNEHYVCNNLQEDQLHRIISRVINTEKIQKYDHSFIHLLDTPRFINYCILTNNINLFKRYLLVADVGVIFSLFPRWDNHHLDRKIYWTLDLYVTLAHYYIVDEYVDKYKLLNNPYFNTNQEITDNFHEVYGGNEPPRIYCLNNK